MEPPLILLQLSLDEIVARATRELWTCGDSDTVQRANTAIIRGACLTAVELVFTAWEEGGDLAASKMREEIRGLNTQLESYKKADRVPAKTQSCEIRNTSVQLGAPTNVMPDAPVLGKFVAGPKGTWRESSQERHPAA
jgi:hypothetical protein